MSAWGTQDMSAALEDSGIAATPLTTTTDAAPPPAVNPQAHGWAAKVAFDYATYNAGAVDAAADEAFDEATRRNNNSNFHWAGDAAVYEWKEEYGDVGPDFPELAEQLFGRKAVAGEGANTGTLNWAGYVFSNTFPSKHPANFFSITNIPVTQEGEVQIRPVRKFEDAALHPVILENVKLCGYDKPTPVQAYTLPAIALNHDIIACAQTGKSKHLHSFTSLIFCRFRQDCCFPHSNSVKVVWQGKEVGCSTSKPS